MPAPNMKQQVEEAPLKIVGGNLFGRYPKISVEETFNFIVSDEFLVPYAGYKNTIPLLPNQVGRGLYASTIGNFMIAVIGSAVYSIDSNLVPHLVGSLYTIANDVYISENNNMEICLTDGVYVYVYDYSGLGTFVSSNPADLAGFTFPGINPGYISFQNGRLIIAALGTQVWWLSGTMGATDWPSTSQTMGVIQSKPCTIQAAVPMPGGGNNLLVFGTNVAESWQDLGLALFPYQRNSTFSIDYGCLNAASIAALENFVVWLSFNEQSGPALVYTTGGPVQQISTDGISFKFGELTNPENCTGFLFRQDGHLIYQFTFPDDNLSYAYDFESKLFFTVTDDELNYHIARQVVFFNNTNYFVSLKGGNVYEFSTNYTDADYGDGDIKQIPRIRVCSPLRFPTQRYFILRSVGFTIENGQPNIVDDDGLYSEVVDLSISRNGGESFGNSIRLNMNPTGQRRSRFIFQRLGIANDATIQLRFSGFGRFLCTDGIAEVYQ